MPFQQRKGSGWAQLGIKRALIEAAEKDYDTFAMTTAKQQIDRYPNMIKDFKGFYQRYDRDYIKILNKFGKKYGQKVEMIEVLQGDNIVEVPSIKITQEWKDDIQRGLAQFNKGGKAKTRVKTRVKKKRYINDTLVTDDDLKTVLTVHPDTLSSEALDIIQYLINNDEKFAKQWREKTEYER